MKIVMVTSEFSPYVKTGGMADAVGDLARVLAKQGHDVRVYMPYYQQVERYVRETKKTLKALAPEWVPMGEEARSAVWLTYQEEVNLRVDFLQEDALFGRYGVYGENHTDYADNDIRFGFFGYAAWVHMTREDWRPDIVHCHDWQSGLVPVLIRRSKTLKTVFTVHNLAYRGFFSKEVLVRWGLGDEAETFDFYGQACFLKAGLVAADMLTTVSGRYAQEIQTEEFGQGLNSVLRQRTESLWGIINGIDQALWDPEHDKNIVATFSKQNMAGKYENKQQLAHLCGFEKPEQFMLAMVTRLVTHKGFDIVMEAMHELMVLPLNMVVIGTGDKQWHQALELVDQRYTSFKAFLFFDEAMARQIYAGADAFLMPSAFEPCGLSQMMAMRYGTVPIVHATGGLVDTVSDWNEATHQGCGFMMREYSSKELMFQVKRALALYVQKELWALVMRQAMSRDFSWEASAQKYESLYAFLMRKHV